MNSITLQQFFRLITMSIFQTNVVYNISKGNDFYDSSRTPYENIMFFCPRIYCKDGFNISLQINNSNYCSSENGYRKFGYTWKEVEFGFPSEYDILLEPYKEDKDESLLKSVGCIPIEVAQAVIDRHGGIDLGVTLNEGRFNEMTKFPM